MLGTGPEIAPLAVFLRTIAALFLGFVVVFVYRKTRSPIEQSPSFPPTLLLMTVLIALVTQVIGNNIARSFSLVGALSIVRFRTQVRDTLDTAFVIFAVTTGMAAGADQLWLALIGLGIVALAAFIVRAKPFARGASQLLTIRVGIGQDVSKQVEPLLTEHLVDRRLISVSSAKHGAAMDTTYEVHFHHERPMDDLVRAISKIEGVVSVDINTPSAAQEDGAANG